MSEPSIRLELSERSRRFEPVQLASTLTDEMRPASDEFSLVVDPNARTFASLQLRPKIFDFRILAAACLVGTEADCDCSSFALRSLRGFCLELGSCVR